MSFRLIPLKMVIKVVAPIILLFVLFSMLNLSIKNDFESENVKLTNIRLVRLLERLSRDLENSSKVENFAGKEKREKPKVLDKAKDLSLEERFLQYNNTEFWKAVGDLENKDELYPEDFDVELVQQKLRSNAITEVKAGPGGSSFKWIMILDGNQKVVFKPQLIPPRTEKKYACNAGHEQPRYEVAAFYLMRLFGSRAVPYVAGRKVNIIKEVLPIADDTVKESIHSYKNGTVCLVHKCVHCPSEREFCFPDGVIEGSLVYWLKKSIHYKFGTKKNPYHMFHSLSANSSFRSYGLNDHRHCDFVRSDVIYKQDRYFLDMVDISIMSYVFAHEDEKHIYTLDHRAKPMLTVHIDHGMTFCEEELSANVTLAALYQCCRVRASSIKGLQSAQKTLTQDFALASSRDFLYPLLEDSQLADVARRINVVMLKVAKCQTVVDDSILFDALN